MVNENFITWAILVVLSSAGYFFSAQSRPGIFLRIMVLLTTVKVFLVAYQYMELKKAHRAWPGILLFILVLYAGGLLLLYL